MSDELVLFHRDEAVSVITLNRQQKLNAISPPLRLALAEAFCRAEEDEQTCVVLLRANGRAFCAGYDIGQDNGEREVWRHDALKWHQYLSEVLKFEMIPWYLRKPVVAAVQGHTLGGGCELAMFCDLTLAADNAVFGEPEVRFCESGPGLIMPWIIGFKRARELLYFGDLIDARQALDLGMINRIVETDDLERESLACAKRLSKIGIDALTATKLAINRGADAAGFRHAMEAGLDVLAPLYAAKTAINQTFEKIVREEGLRAALNWRHAQLDEDR